MCWFAGVVRILSARVPRHTRTRSRSVNSDDDRSGRETTTTIDQGERRRRRSTRERDDDDDRPGRETTTTIDQGERESLRSSVSSGLQPSRPLFSTRKQKHSLQLRLSDSLPGTFLSSSSIRRYHSPDSAPFCACLRPLHQSGDRTRLPWSD